MKTVQVFYYNKFRNRDLVLVSDKECENLFDEIFKRTNDYIKTSDILRSQYKIKVRLEYK